MRKTLTASERRYLDKARVCRLGSTEPDGRPHVAPLSHAVVGRTLYMATDRDGRTARNLRRRPRAALVCDEYSENWDRLRGVVVRARARSIDRGPELAKAQRALVKKFRQYKSIEIDYVLALRIEAATSWGL